MRLDYTGPTRAEQAQQASNGPNQTQKKESGHSLSLYLLLYLSVDPPASLFNLVLHMMLSPFSD